MVLVGVISSLADLFLLSVSVSCGSNPVMIVCSLLAALCMGARIIISKYITNQIDPLTYMAVSFIADGLFGCAFCVLTLAHLFHLEFVAGQLTMVLVGVISSLADIFLFLALAPHAPAGPVVAIVTSNGILLLLLDMAAHGTVPSALQVVGTVLSILGVMAISVGDHLLPQHTGERL